MTDQHEASMAVAEINGDRLWQRHMEMAQVGATGRGGVNRQALTPEDAQARALLLGWAASRGFSTELDPIGNLFILRPGRDPSASPVLAGSHLDTQPAGGNFDGVFGVLAAFEALETLEDAGTTTQRPLEVVVWTNEEGARFQPTTMGSAVFAGALALNDVLNTTDRAGVTVAEALGETLKALPGTGRRGLGFPVHAYLEAHIEQGPVLEATGTTIGAVTAIQGLRWFTVEVHGEEAHAGTTPRRSRRDALAAAVHMVTALEELMRDEEDTVRFTVGRFEVLPNSPNTVPGRVLFTIDFRHPEHEVLARLGGQVEQVCRLHQGDCTVIVTETLNSSPTRLDSTVLDVVRRAAWRLELPQMDIVSGATHDAKYMAGLCPTGMVFVPCLEGISHSEAERASLEDLVSGARILAEALVELAGR